MATTSRAIATPVPSVNYARRIQPQERIALVFFVYLAALGLLRGIALTDRLLLLAIPVVLSGLWVVESARSTTGSRIAREWSSLGLILAGYWSVGCFQSAPFADWQLTWVEWDRALLDGLSLRNAVEAGGVLVPSLLEITYLLLYSIPPLSLGVLYLSGRRSSAGRYLQVLFLGTFSAYALLPLFPILSPRIAFPGADLPQLLGLTRPINTWILDHLDISISVFPSGHVAVAFSSAFGMLAALRDRRRIWVGAFAAALAVYVATVYGRYHYAVDGIASIVIAGLSWKIISRNFPRYTTGKSRPLRPELEPHKPNVT